MKVRDIVIGGIYSNGKQGRYHAERKVIDINHEGKYKLYSEQADCSSVLYDMVKGSRKLTNQHITLQSFSNWAKNRIQ
jgi:hypothetical protein